MKKVIYNLSLMFLLFCTMNILTHS